MLYTRHTYRNVTYTTSHIILIGASLLLSPQLPPKNDYIPFLLCRQPGIDMKITSFVADISVYLFIHLMYFSLSWK